MKHTEMLARDVPCKDRQEILHVTNKVAKSTNILEVFSDYEILLLQDRFLTNGFQHIQMADVESSRILIEVILTSLDCYHNVACLTLEQESLSPGITHLYKELCLQDAGSAYIACIEDYITNHFYFDFLWIELTDNLCSQVWFEQFKQGLLRFGVVYALPIVNVRYESKTSQSRYV